MKKWFLTENNQLLDLNNMESFWIEDVPNEEFHVFCQDKDKADWRIAEYEKLSQAQDYIHYINEILNL